MRSTMASASMKSPCPQAKKKKRGGAIAATKAAPRPKKKKKREFRGRAARGGSQTGLRRAAAQAALNRGFADGMMASAHRGRDEVVSIGLARRALQELTVETGLPEGERRDVTKKRARGVLRCCGAFTSLDGLVAIARCRGWFCFRF